MNWLHAAQSIQRTLTGSVARLVLTGALLLTPCLASATPLLAESAWGGAQTIGDSDSSNTGPAVAKDGSNVVVVWIGDSNIQYNYSTDGGATWSDAEPIDPGMSSYCDVPQVALSGNNAVAVWYEVIGGQGRIRASCSDDGGATWSTPVAIDGGVYGCTGPNVAIEGDDVVAVWLKNADSTWYVYADHSSDGGGTWAGAQVVASGTGYSSETADCYPRVVIDDGHVVAVWWSNRYSETTYDWVKEIHSIHSADCGANWDTAQIISTATEAYPPRVAMCGLNVVALWNDNGGNTTICSNRSEDGGATWEGVATIDNGAMGGKYSPHIAMSGSGVVAVWYQYDMGAGVVRVWSNCSGDGGLSWDGPQAVDSTNTSNALEPYVSLSGTNAAAVWYIENDGTAQRAYGSLSDDGGQTWSAPQLIQADVAERVYWIRVTSGSGAVAVWTQFPDSGSYICSNYTLQTQDPPAFIGAWGTSGTGETEFAGPQGVAVDPNGIVYVADTNNHRMQKFTSTGSYLGEWGSFGTGDGEFSSPIHVAARSGDAVYVTDGDNDRVQYFDADGAYLGQFGTTGDMSGDGPGEFVWTMGIAIDSFFDVYVTDWGNHRVQKFDSDGDYVGQWGSGLFTSPFGLATDASDNVYLAEWGNNRIQKFDGDVWTVFSDSSGLNSPSGIAVADDGTVYVCDTENHRVQVFDSDGNFVTRWGSYGTAYGQFKRPMGIAIHPNGDIYVADTENHRIQVFSYRELSSLDIPLTAGWNMVSVPLAMFPSNSTPGTVFPGAAAIYTWNPVTKSYEVPENITPERGYWVAATGAATITVSGQQVGIWHSQLTEGWNMVGSVCGEPVPAVALSDDPSGSILDGSVYWWNPTSKSYSTSTDLQQGKGYWVATNVDCDLTMAAPPS